jgi:hypothetical protein
MALTFRDYINYLSQNEKDPIYRISLLRKEDETVYQTVTDSCENNSGALTISLQDGCRRSTNFSILNYDNSFSSFVENLSIGSKFKLELGFSIDGTEFFLDQGVFVFDNPSMLSKLSDRKINFAGKDKWAYLDGSAGGIIDRTITIPLGSYVGNTIRSLLALNIVSDPKDLIIDSSLEDLTLPYTITKEIGDTVADIILEITFAVSANVFYDTSGSLTVRKFVNDMQKGSIYDFTYLDYNYLGSEKKYLFNEIFNSVVVIGENVQLSLPIIAEAINYDLTDTNSYPNLGYKKVKKITEYINGITTQELADERASYELALVKRKQSAVDISAVPFYHLDVNEIITLEDSYVNSNVERFIINNINVPIGTSGEMSLNITKAIV